jgi:hypothetical protein
MSDQLVVEAPTHKAHNQRAELPWAYRALDPTKKPIQTYTLNFNPYPANVENRVSSY